MPRCILDVPNSCSRWRGRKLWSKWWELLEGVVLPLACCQCANKWESWDDQRQLSKQTRVKTPSLRGNQAQEAHSAAIQLLPMVQVWYSMKHKIGRKYPHAQKKALWLLSFLSCHCFWHAPLRGSVVGNLKWKVIHKLFVCQFTSTKISHWVALSQFWKRELLLKVLQISDKFTDVVALQISSLHRHKPDLNGCEEVNKS